MREFLFIRHGETDWNVVGRMQGQIQGVPLNEKGLKQARDAALLLAAQPFDLIVSSTLDRAAATAQVLAEPRQTPIVYDKRLIERSWGVAEGLTYKELEAQDPAGFFTEDGKMDWIATNKRQPKDSESFEKLAERASQAVTDIMAHYADKRLLLVTHGAWLRALTGRLTGAGHIYPNAIPYVAREDAGHWEIERLA